MHLAIVSPFPPAITGIGQYGYHVTRALARSGSFSQITVLAGSQVNGQRPPNLDSTEIEYCWRVGQLNARQAIRSRVRNLRPDLVWFNLGVSIFGKSPLFNLSGLLTPMSIARSFPTVVTMHELVELADLRALNAPGGILAPWGARLLTILAAQADMTCLTMRHYAEWMSARQVACTYIPIGAYHEPELLDESDSHELLFFTTLAPYKGLELLLEAFCRLKADYPRLRLTIAGAEHARFPNYAVKLKSQFNEADGVRWSGQIPEDQVKDFFRRSQIIVLPYTASTGASSVLYQAATWGRAIVASDLEEIGSLANESNLQVEFFKNGDVGSLCRSIRALLDSPEKRRAQAIHNYKSIQHTRPEETCRKYIQVFNIALEKRQHTKRIPIMESA